MSRIAVHVIGLAGIVGAMVACAATPERNTFDAEDPGPAAPPGAGGGGAGGSTGAGIDGWDPGAPGTGGSSSAPCTDNPGVDDDGDGFLDAQDCNDCDANVNPAAIEVVADTGAGGGGGAPAAPVDEDCDGVVDNAPGTCDDGLALDDADPLHGAWAIDICRQASGPSDWGLVSAGYVRASGLPVTGPSSQFGIQSNFGSIVTPRGGARMLALSTGRARIPGQPEACGTLTCEGPGAGAAPPGFPQSVPNCPGDSAINDDIALEVQLRAPSNATGLKFDFRFYSFEYPEWVCSAFNDQFIALMSPPPAGSINGNISFDSMSNPVSVNVAFFDVCAGCALGAGELAGSGFDEWNDAGGTSWLETTAPVAGGDLFSIRFAIWDTGDQAWDSTAVIDNFQWIASGGTVEVGTAPVPE